MRLRSTYDFFIGNFYMIFRKKEEMQQLMIILSIKCFYYEDVHKMSEIGP